MPAAPRPTAPTAGGEEQGLAQYAKDSGNTVIATKVRATVTGVEVKSGTASLSAATATLDGRTIQITRTVLVRVSQ